MKKNEIETKRFWMSKRFWMLISSLASLAIMAGTFDFAMPLVKMGIPTIWIGRITGIISLSAIAGTLYLQFSKDLTKLK